VKWLYRIFAFLNVANGLWMLAAPAGWFGGLPGGGAGHGVPQPAFGP
jgi:hypothetical protein